MLQESLCLRPKPVNNKSETEGIPAFLNSAQTLGTVETALFEAHVFTEAVLEAAEQRGIELLCPEGQSLGEDWSQQSDKQIPKSHFIYQAN